jgi:hypothetical protein
MTGNAYRTLLTFLSGISSQFSLVVQEQFGRTENLEAIVNALRPYCLGSSERNEWPGTVLLYGTASVLTYRVCPDSIALMSTAASDLYSWRQPERPEDVAFYRSSGSVVLETIVHERDARVFLTDTEVGGLRALLPNCLQPVDGCDERSLP